MLTKSIKQSFEYMLRAYKIEPSEYLLHDTDPVQPAFPCSSVDEAVRAFARIGARYELVVVRDDIRVDELSNYAAKSRFPFVVITSKNGKHVPVVIGPGVDPQEPVHCSMDDDINVTSKFETSPEFLSDLCTIEKEGNELYTPIITIVPNKPIFSSYDETGQPTDEAKRFPLLRKFSRLLRHERKEIGYVIVYAVIAGLISLSLPLGVQSIVSFVSSGRIATSVVVLIVFIVLGLLISGAMQIMQLYLAEHIQQRLFSKTAFEFAFRIPRVKLESVLKEYPPELVNRFFDIVTLQKGTATILLEFSAAALQIVFGLILLSLYHPMFIILGLILIGALFVVLRLTGPRGLATSLKESKYKYKIANWLEVLAGSMTTFKLAGDNTLPLQRTDQLLSNYLYARGKHFKVLAGQYVAFVLFKTVVTGGLLVAGCILIVQKEINLGQFIASEIVIILLMGAVEKLILKLDTVYDVLTSIDKISQVTNLPIEPSGTIPIPSSDKGLQVKIADLKYQFPDRKEYTMNGINLEIKPGEHVCISGFNGSGKTSLVNIMLGMLGNYEGSITYDNIPLSDIERDSLLIHIGDYVSQEELFDGTLLENVTIGRRGIKVEEVVRALDAVGLTEYVQQLPQGLTTRMVGGGMRVPGTIARKVIIARAIVGEPRLLLLDDFLMGVETKQKQEIMNYLLSKEHKWTVIVVSNDPLIMAEMGRIVLLKDGQIHADGLMEEIKKSVDFNELFFSR
jgi:ABC-type bacteriocin/lantibiotic exporter with double-glycine peptidase domain